MAMCGVGKLCPMSLFGIVLLQQIERAHCLFMQLFLHEQAY